MRKLVNTEEFFTNKISKSLFKLVQPCMDHFLGFHALNSLYAKTLASQPSNAQEFCDSGLNVMKSTVDVDEVLRGFLSAPGPTVVVCNHPLGGIDSLALIQTVAEESVGGWKMLANQLLRGIAEMRDNIISVYPHVKENKAANLQAIKEMHRCLKGGETLVMFPAARVSGRHSEHGFVCDLPWVSHPLSLAIKHGARIVCCYISGQNSKKFLSIPPEELTKRTIALAKEVVQSQNSTLHLKHSFTMTPEFATNVAKFSNKEEILRAYSYIGADKTVPKPAQQVSGDVSLYLSDSEINYYELLKESQVALVEQNGFTSYLFQGADEPVIMEELGRLRSKTFKFIGAGSDREVDLFPEDDYYHHIIVTENSSGKIAGAYRVGFTESIIKEQGREGLYLNSVFEIEDDLYEKVGPAMELSRSFIPLEFQKSPQVLDILWKSLGQTSVKLGCKVLYGSVTISADFTPLSQAILVDTLDRYHSADSEYRKLISNDNPFKATTMYHPLVTDAYAEHGLNRLNTVIREIEEDQRPIPPLMRYYTTMGAKFLSFKVEPTFANAIYCLLMIDSDKIPKRYKKRFFDG